MKSIIPITFKQFFGENEMKKTEQSVKTSIYNLIPKTDTIYAVKILVMLLHCYRIIKNFVGSNSKLKKHLAETLNNVIATVKNFKTVDLAEYTDIFNNINVDPMYTKERREAWSLAKQNGKAPCFNKYDVYLVNNLRNADNKALNEDTEEQQFCSNVNSLLNGKSNNKKGVFYRTDNSTIEEFSIMLNSYLEESISYEEMIKYISGVK